MNNGCVQRGAAAQRACVGPGQPHLHSALTWGGDAVSVARHVVVQGKQQYPHGQGEHAGQETVEDQVEEQDESWSWAAEREAGRHKQAKKHYEGSGHSRLMYNVNL